MGFTSLAYRMDLAWLREAFHRTRKDGATGVDGQTWFEYAKDLENHLQSLLDRAKSGTYRAPPVRRVHIPKGGSTTETRPIGIPTLEDKVLQRAVVMLLEPIYEQDFYPGSYGFRPARSAHQALNDLWQQTMNVGGGWILEVDIRKFFDTLDHAHLRQFLRRRVLDGVLTRLIGKWLKAGVMEDGNISYPEAGSPQGGVVSPILANVFLHYVLDEWFVQEVQPRLLGQAHLVRYADDFVILFTHEADAHRVMAVLPQRFAKFGLTVHPDKTRLIPFRQPRRQTNVDDGTGPPGTFDLLGFTHYWGKARNGCWVVMRKTATKRLTRAVRSIAQWCRLYRHRPICEQHAKLCQKVRGHYAYYGITNNFRSLRGFLEAVQRVWRKWLDRRNSRREMIWERFVRLLERYPLPPPRIVHSYVKQRNHGLRNRML
jgi:group II intron reverse transcriptase/maturase